jgi:hypothetical protein
MNTSFDGSLADFSGISGGRGLRLSSFLQLNRFSLNDSKNEEQVETKQNDDDSARFSINFDRQFLYLIRHNPTGLLVTIGRYYKPQDQDQHRHEDDHDEHDHDGHEHDHHEHDLS